MVKLDWKHILERSIPIFNDFSGRGITPTVRTIYYALVSKELIPNTRSAYQGLVKMLVKARKNEVVDWAWIADETRATRGTDYPAWEPEEYAKAYIEYVFEKLQDYKLPKWLNQEQYVECWIEKFALAATFHNWLGDMNVVLVPSRGYSSWTFLKEATDRIETNAEGRETIILYFGDFDPSGRDIERFIAESLEWFGVDAIIHNIAVTQDQIDRYKLPHSPEDSEEIAKMMRDPRFKQWEHGLFRVELDALMAFVPDEFERIIKESVETYFNEDIYAETLKQQEDEQKIVWEKAKELLAKKIEEIKDNEDE
jgi:hypothetical protein